MNNNPRFNSPEPDSPDALKSEIDTTRRRMDDTIDALASRMKGRHLLDEVIAFFRSRSSHHNGDGHSANVRAKISQSASTVMHASLDTVKAHPIPTLLIGAGVAWLVYEKSRKPSYGDSIYDPDYDARLAAGGWEDDVPYDYPASDLGAGGTIYGAEGEVASQGTLSGYTDTGATSGKGAEFKNKANQLKGKAAALKGRAAGKMAAMRDQLKGRTADMSARGREQAHHLGERVQAGYSATRERVSSTVDQHPLESALACLAIGALVGLLLPTPGSVSRAAAPTARRLRDQASELGHDLKERGRHVAQSAVDAARRTAEEEGLTAEGLKGKVTHVATSARDAAAETANEEGLTQKDDSSGSDLPKSPNPPNSPSGF